MAQNYVLLDRIELNADTASVTFSNIPQTGYTDLKIVFSARSTSATYGGDYMLITFNGVTTGYSGKLLIGPGSGSPSSASVSTAWAAQICNDNQTANTFGNGEIYIPNYTSSNYKSFSSDSTSESNGTNTERELAAGLWSNTAAITSINLKSEPGNAGVLSAGSTFSLYGIANADVTPAIAPKADGGNVIATDGTYWYHAFLSNGTFTPQANLTADILQVAGGGSGTGGDYACAGGGAGGLLTFTGQSLTTSTGYTCIVGAGGAVKPYNTGNGNNGSNSQFASLTASVGGGGAGGFNGSSDGQNGNAGGSGGGGSYLNHTGGAGTTGQGYAGGTAVGAAPGYPGGSGGGAGGAGQNPPNSSTGATGGVGLYSTLTDAMGLATATGQLSGGHYYYAGGGAGGGYISSTGGTGGLGGGGNGQGAGGGAVGYSGTANTGGGGGGNGQGGNPGAGGSGIIIIRYPIAS